MEHTVENTNAEIVLSRIEQKFYKADVTLRDHVLVRIISGEMKIMQADLTYLFQAGDTFIFPRNQLATVIKYAKDDQPYQSIVMNISTSRLKNYYQENEIKRTFPTTHSIKPLGEHPLLDSYFASLIPYFDLSARVPENLSILKVAEAITILRTIDKGIDKLLMDFSEPGKIDLTEFMEKNFMYNLPLKKFSYLTGRSLTTFKKDFKNEFQMTPQKWLIQKRLERAYFLITQKNKKPIEVCYEVGFENLSHFSYAFKKHFGDSPRNIYIGNG